MIVVRGGELPGRGEFVENEGLAWFARMHLLQPNASATIVVAGT